MFRPADSAVSFEDPLAWLPRKPVQQFARKRVIYDSRQQADSLYVVVSGRVKVLQTATDGSQTVIRIVPPDGFFGESALIGSTARSEIAMALDTVRAMAWSAVEIEQQIEREPRLGLALVQHMVRQCLDLEERIQCMAICKTPERVALALVQLSEALGSREEDGAMRMGGLTHHTLAEYVGTSREIVTFQLNRLRRLGMLKYTRKYIDVYSQAIIESLREHSLTLPLRTEKRVGAGGLV